jgi:Ca2+-binding EF-hand superfamily protein
MAGLAGPTASGFDASATKTLVAAFKHIHNAAFTKFDANGDKAIDEYEAGPGIDLKDFQKADKNRNGKLTKTEFLAYADGDSFFGFFHQDKNKFMSATRDALYKAFQKLDSNRDRLLSTEEMNNKALKKLGIYLEIPGLHLKVTIDELDKELYTQNDRTGDKSLSQAEFEDYCMDEFIYRINPNFDPNPAPAPTPSEEPAPAPADDSEG